MSLIRYGKEIECPKCQSTNIEAVPLLYQSLKSNSAGKKIFSDDPRLSKIEQLHPHHKEKLLNRLMPPEEPQKNLPAKAIALMAFLISWIGTCSLILARLGYKQYFLISFMTAVILAIPFYTILRLVIGNFRKQIGKYQKLRDIWEKLLFCQDCYHVFTLKELR